ncbi:hypothetical protein L7F22_042243 [Adiantum nelumboides]|nr:hypothetical protein [Adiantum nelumboides]
MSPREFIKRGLRFISYYNLLDIGDQVRAPAVRNVKSESSTGSIESHRVRVTLTIQVTKTYFDSTGSSAPPDPTAIGGANASGTPAEGEGSIAGALGGGSGGEGATMQVSGRVVSENKHVKMGAFHTLDLEVHRQLTIIKESWDSIHLERLSDSSDVGQRAEVGAIILEKFDGSSQSPEVSSQLKDTKFAREGQMLDKFQRMLASDELRAWYGESHVMMAAARGAIGSLLISDGLFRASDPVRRKHFVQLVEDVRSQGGEVSIFSGMHETGRQLNGLTGIAAILRYPWILKQPKKRNEKSKKN